MPAWLTNIAARAARAYAAGISHLDAAIDRLEPQRTRKSIGEKKLIELLPGWGWSRMAQQWSENRHELVTHFRGWNFIAIRAIAEAFAEMPPQIATLHRSQEVGRERKRLHYSTRDSWKRGKRLAKFNAKFATARVRKKAMANLQPGDELEPVSPDHRLARLLRNPNGPDVSWTFLYKLVMHLELTGIVYIWCVPGRDGLPSELWVLPANWVRAVGGTSKLIEEYEIRPVNGYLVSETGIGWYGGAAGYTRLPEEQIISIAYPSPVHFIDGHSPIGATAEWIDCSEAIDRSRVAQFQNAAMPGVVITCDADMEELDDPAKQRLKAEIDAKYVGVKRTGKPIVLAPGMTMTAVTHTPVEMDYNLSSAQLADQLLATHKVGKATVGMTEYTNRAAMETGVAQFYMGNIRPKLQLIDQVLTEKLAPRFDESRKTVIYHDDPVPADPAQKLQETCALLDRKVITVNEARQEYGHEPYAHGGDDPTDPATGQPNGWATGEQPEPQLADEMSGRLAQLAGKGGAADNGQEKPQAIGALTHVADVGPAAMLDLHNRTTGAATHLNGKAA